MTFNAIKIRYLVFSFFVCLAADFASIQKLQAQENDFDRRIDSLVTLANTLPDGKERLDVLNIISMNHNNVDSVEKYTNHQLSLALKMREYNYVTSAYLSLGWCYYYRYNYPKANEYYFKALHISDSTGSKSNVAQCYHSIANTMAMMKKFIESDEYDRKALKLFYEMDDSANISNIYRSLGQTCCDFCLYDNAKEHLSNALEIDTRLNLKNNIANDYLNLGYVDRDKFNDTQIDSLLLNAKKLILEAHNLFKSIRSEVDVLITCQELMEIYFKIAQNENGEIRANLIDSSKIFHDEGLKLAIKNDFISDTYYFNIIEARYAIEDKKFDVANKKLNETKRLIQSDTTLQFFLVDLYEVFVDYYKATKKYKLAYEYQCMSDQIKKSTFNREYAMKSANSDVQNEINEIRHKQELKETEIELTRDIQLRRHRITSISGSILLVLLIITIFTSYKSLKSKHRLGEILEKSNQKIEQHRDQLAIVHDDIEAGIYYAKSIQNSMIPSDEMMKSIWGDFLLIWNPLNIISGDFYWTVKTDGISLLTVVDCTGHGVPGAFMSVLGMSTLADITNTQQFRNGELSAADILNQMRAKVIESLRQTEQSSMALDGMDMALCLFNEQTMTMQYAGAFRPLVIIRDSNKEITYKADKMPVGYLSENQKPFTNYIVDLQDGDTLFMFSDGIPDQFGYNENNEEVKFTTKRLVRILQSNIDKSFEEQKDIIIDILDKWCNKTGCKPCIQTDDELLLGIKFSKQDKHVEKQNI